MVAKTMLRGLRRRALRALGVDAENVEGRARDTRAPVNTNCPCAGIGSFNEGETPCPSCRPADYRRWIDARAKGMLSDAVRDRLIDTSTGLTFIRRGSIVARQQSDGNLRLELSHTPNSGITIERADVVDARDALAAFVSAIITGSPGTKR